MRFFQPLICRRCGNTSFICSTSHNPAATEKVPIILNISVTTTCLLIGMPTAIYTMFGGVQAVTWTDVKTMALIVFGLFAVIVAAVLGYPDGVGLGDGLGIAAATGRLRVFDFSPDITNQYTVWSGTIAALFLFCSY